MKYYAERNGMLLKDYNIDFEDLKTYFYKIYQYFYNMNCFKAAIDGIWTKNQQGEKYQAVPPLLAPSPEIFFMNHLSSTEIYPIHQYYEDYMVKELFTVIEVLYDKISIYNYEKNILETQTVKRDFAIQINNILKFYNGGYFLEPNSGTIAKGVDSSLKMMLSEDLSQIINEDIMEKMRAALRLYYRFDSNLEIKKKAINILADILEPLRKELKDILNDKYDVNKDYHDKLIFDIVNNFNIRHNNSKQKTNYEHEIWYDWMMQYYTSVIITYYKLKLETK